MGSNRRFGLAPKTKRGRLGCACWPQLALPAPIRGTIFLVASPSAPRSSKGCPARRGRHRCGTDLHGVRKEPRVHAGDVGTGWRIRQPSSRAFRRRRLVASRSMCPWGKGARQHAQGIPNHVHLARQLADVAPSKNQAFHGKRFVPLVRSHHTDHPRAGLAFVARRGCSQSLGDIGSMPLVGIDGALAYLRVVLAPQRPTGQRRLGAPVGTRDERLPRLVLGARPNL